MINTRAEPDQRVRLAHMMLKAAPARGQAVRCGATAGCARLPTMMKQRVLKAVTVRFEEPVRSALEEIAEREHRTLAEQIRFIVAKSLADRQRQSEAA